MKKSKLVTRIAVFALLALPVFYISGRTGTVEASVQHPNTQNPQKAEIIDPSDFYDADVKSLLTRLSGNISPKAFRCLAQAVYFEARSEPFEGQVAVAYVVLNRVKDRHYPDNICAVVFQNEKRRHHCQFSFACDGLSDNPYERAAWNRARRVAGGVLLNALSDFTADSTHYHAKYVHPRWAKYLQPTLQVGQHIFYREDL